MTDREKLIELLIGADDYCYDTCNEGCNVCKYNGNVDCAYNVHADHLIANGVTVQKWIPVTERLPEKDGEYLVFEKSVYGTRTRTLRFAKDGRKVDKYDFHREWKNVWFYYDCEWGHITIDTVTHWMPLPEPPKGE